MRLLGSSRLAALPSSVVQYEATALLADGHLVSDDENRTPPPLSVKSRLAYGSFAILGLSTFLSDDLGFLLCRKRDLSERINSSCTKIDGEPKFCAFGT